MTTLRILCRGGEVLATNRDLFKQLDGTLIDALALTTEHTIPGKGRVLAVRIVPPADGVLPCSQCGALVADLDALREHGRAAHRMTLAGQPLLTLITTNGRNP